MTPAAVEQQGSERVENHIGKAKREHPELFARLRAVCVYHSKSVNVDAHVASIVQMIASRQP